MQTAPFAFGFYAYNIPIIIYFRRMQDAARNHTGDGAPAAARRHGGEQQGQLRQCAGRGGQHGLPRGGGALHRGRFARRSGLVYLASVEPVIQLVLSRTPECCACGCRTAPTAASTRRTPTRCAAGSRTGTPFCWPGPGWGRAPPMSVRPCSAETPRGPVPCWMPTH